MLDSVGCIAKLTAAVTDGGGGQHRARIALQDSAA